MLPTDILLIGEQHDAPDHQRLQGEVVLAIARQGKLAALALEMAESGQSTVGLPTDATEQQVQTALAWKDAAWPWRAYGPVVMAAVRSGILVAGANLPSNQMRAAMVNPELDTRLSPKALDDQRRAIRDGHCGLLPDPQIGPMTRIQIARDLTMARTAESLAEAGKTVVLVAGGGHVLSDRGVPRHLVGPWKARSLLLRAGAAAADQPDVDAMLETRPIAPVDYCEGLRQRKPATGGVPAPTARDAVPANR